MDDQRNDKNQLNFIPKARFFSLNSKIHHYIKQITTSSMEKPQI
jgi:hypothetical protein